MSECVKNMFHRIKLIVIFIVIGFLLSFISRWLQSDFLSQFYSITLVSVILACTALSFAMYSFIANKLIEIKKRFPQKFRSTNHELYVALKTQIGLLGILIVLLICYHSPIIINEWKYASLTLETFISSIIICFIHIMYDLGKTTYYIVLSFELIMSRSLKNDSSQNAL